MIIERNVAMYCVDAGASLRTALEVIDRNTEGFVFCIGSGGALEGVLTDGDCRRWLIRQGAVNMAQPVSDVMRREYISARLSDSAEKINRLLNDRIRFIPLLDAHNRLVGVARRRRAEEVLRIGRGVIGAGRPVFVIAEIGINHNGSPDRAMRLIDAARDAGVDCVKFQMRRLDRVYRRHEGDLSGEDLGTQYTLNLLARFELEPKVMRELFAYARAAGLTPLCTPWDDASLAELEADGMEGYKVASADMTNHPLLEKLADTGKPLLVSTGMSVEDEIAQTVSLLRRRGSRYALLHCNSTYPAPFKDVHLRYLKRLREIGGCPVGYSGHERDIFVAVAAVAAGACIIEKHITEDRNLEGSDHKVSLLPDEWKRMVEGIRQVEQALGSGESRTISQGELMNRANLAKSLIAKRAIRMGEFIDASMVEIKSPGRGLQPNRLRELIGKAARRDIAEGDFFYSSDIEQGTGGARAFRFNRPWGVSVRWHDFKQILDVSNPDFLEFHLSFRDMDEEYLRHFDRTYDLDLKVHSPDTFLGDHLLDLANPDEGHRERSIRELQRVIDLTRSLKPFFKRATRPVIIASLGGFTTDRLLEPDEVVARYARMAESLRALDCDGVEIIGQTLPPFPWYFGGQMYLNLFVKPEDTARFCAEQNMRLCFDISHTKLACNHYRMSFKEVSDRLAPLTAHFHIADADGVDGEGLQIGEGDIDFPAFIDQARRLAPDASFIPEIWQGHKNNGEGFWLALERLEQLHL